MGIFPFLTQTDVEPADVPACKVQHTSSEPSSYRDPSTLALLNWKHRKPWAWDTSKSRLENKLISPLPWNVLLHQDLLLSMGGTPHRQQRSTQLLQMCPFWQCYEGCRRVPVPLRNQASAIWAGCPENIWGKRKWHHADLHHGSCMEKRPQFALVIN